MTRFLSSVMMASLVAACGPAVGEHVDPDRCGDVLDLPIPSLEEISVPAADGASTMDVTMRSYAGFSAVSSLASGDFDGDGTDDVAVGINLQTKECEGRPFVRIFFGSEDGLVDGPTLPMTGVANQPLLLGGDLDRDGRDELIVYETSFTFGPNLIQILEIGPERIEALATLDFGEDEPASIVVGDFDGNGAGDLFVGFSHAVPQMCDPVHRYILNVLEVDGGEHVEAALAEGAGEVSLVAATEAEADAVWVSLPREGCLGNSIIDFAQLRLTEAGVELGNVVPNEELELRAPGSAVDLNKDGVSELLITHRHRWLSYHPMRSGVPDPDQAQTVIEASSQLQNVAVLGVLTDDSRAASRSSLVAHRAGGVTSDLAFVPFDAAGQYFEPSAAQWVALPEGAVLEDSSIGARVYEAPQSAVFFAGKWGAPGMQEVRMLTTRTRM